MAKYPKIGKHHGQTEFDENGLIVAFHRPVKKFKRVIRQKHIKGCPKGFEIRIQINRYNQIHDFFPREFNGKNLFDKYHGRQGDGEIQNLIFEATSLYLNN